MGNKLGYQNEEENYKFLIDENKNESFLKDKSIEGSGSDSVLNSINSQPKDIDHSSKSSIHPIVMSNNSISNGNENKTKNNSLISNKKVNNTNNNDSNFSKISDINKFDTESLKADIFNLIEVMKGNDSKRITNNTDIKKEEPINDKSNDNNVFNNTTNLIRINIDKEKINKKGNNNKIENDEYKILINEILIRVKEGYFPFFIKAEDFSPNFYYGKEGSPIIFYIEDYCKENKVPKDKYIFYYKDIIVNIEDNLKDINMEMFGIIEGKENSKKNDDNLKHEIYDKNIGNIKLKISEEVVMRIKEGYLPLFIRAEGFDPKFYYGKPEYPLKLYIEDYFKENNMLKDNYLFYYNNIKIDIEKNLKDLDMEMLGEIQGKLK